jgi:hypothetical protein
VPTEGGEPGQSIFGERKLRAAFDRDVVIGIENDQFAQVLMTCIRSGL